MPGNLSNRVNRAISHLKTPATQGITQDLEMTTKLDNFTPWYEKYESIYAHELEEILSRWPDSNPSEERSASGLAVYFTYPTPDGAQVRLRISYPPIYPYRSATVFLSTDEMLLWRHHHPLSGQLCLLANEGRSWRYGAGEGQYNSMAELLDKMLPDIFVIDHKIKEGTPLSGIDVPEYPQGEPFELYFKDAGSGKSFIVPNESIPPHIQKGIFRYRWFDKEKYIGVVTSISDSAGNLLVKLDVELPAGNHSECTGYWIRSSKVPHSRHDLSVQLISSDISQKKVTGILFPSESQQNTYKDGWLFLSDVHSNKKGKPSNNKVHVRPAYLSSNLYYSRACKLEPLARKRVAVLGLGAIGSPVAAQLARSGVGHLTLIDHDHYEAANTIRHELGIGYTGLLKVEGLSEYFAEKFPYTTIHALPFQIGGLDENNHQLIEEELRRSDLVIDCTAEPTISHWLSEVIFPQTSIIHATLTPGYWGGEVLHAKPGGACWCCLVRASNCADKLPYDPTAPKQVPGCGAPSVQGAGFDADTIAIKIARKSVGYLIQGNEFDDLSWNLGLLTLTNENGRYLSTEQWECSEVSPEPNCRCKSYGA